ncbi:Ig-like domain (group 3) [Micromonospora pattaloongensis]|uniref:Ig-like domain (Group 3) n=1 Tax=Micromonospora pattaloongensis TaxID=405436 RepID=A0A1H3R9P6_9ACTN|nr:Ig-like domain-containing protein [Micromonospora pattaloongensis]SDZ22360.1 Ig-like domain (group 3) [Micromonospora pattaloongensis]
MAHRSGLAGPHARRGRAALAASVVAALIASPAPVAAEETDAEPPAVSIISPAANLRVRGVVNVRAAATDNVGVTRVDVYAAGVLAGTRSAEPWTVPVDTTGRNGSVPIRVEAFDAAGNSAAATVSVIADHAGPIVDFVAPDSKAALTGFVNSVVQPTDPAGVAVAELYVSGQLVVRRTRWPWTGFVYLAGHTGAVQLQWQLTDRLGNRTVVSRTVYADHVAPTVRVTKGPRHTAQVRGTIPIVATASDARGIRLVELVVNRVTVKIDTNAPHGFRLDTTRYNGRFTWRIRVTDRAGNVTITPERIAYAAKWRR